MRGSSRGRGKWTTTALALGAVALALGCGSGESEPAGGGVAPAAPAAQTPPAPPPAAPTPEQVTQTLEDMYEWDPASGPAHDLAVDIAACQTQVTSEGLQGVAQHIQCMRQKGWKTRDPQS